LRLAEAMCERTVGSATPRSRAASFGARPSARSATTSRSAGVSAATMPAGSPRGSCQERRQRRSPAADGGELGGDARQEPAQEEHRDEPRHAVPEEVGPLRDDEPPALAVDHPADRVSLGEQVEHVARARDRDAAADPEGPGDHGRHPDHGGRDLRVVRLQTAVEGADQREQRDGDRGPPRRPQQTTREVGTQDARDREPGEDDPLEHRHDGRPGAQGQDGVGAGRGRHQREPTTQHRGGRVQQLVGQAVRRVPRMDGGRRPRRRPRGRRTHGAEG
jgi:hypothetical protein